MAGPASIMGQAQYMLAMKNMSSLTIHGIVNQEARKGEIWRRNLILQEEFKSTLAGLWHER